MSAYSIRRMSKSEVDLSIDRAAREGWNPGLHDADCFRAIDPDGFFAGEIDGRIVACGAALNYDDRFAFCGLYMVESEFRGRGLGLALTRARLEHVGQRNAGLDGVLNMVDRYARLGYRRSHLTTRYTFTPRERQRESAFLTPAGEADFAAIANYDAQHFFARRAGFLQKWLTQAGSRAVVFQHEDSIGGFGVIRPCRQGYKIGPLFADDAHAARDIFVALCNHALGQQVSLDIPEPNAAGIAMANEFGLQPAFACIRMYLRGDPELPLARIYGNTTLEAG
jgi:GNAT superfamily N-acetyltransferase